MKSIKVELVSFFILNGFFSFSRQGLFVYLIFKTKLYQVL